MKKNIEEICFKNIKKESCGFLMMYKEKIQVIECDNVSLNPENSFEINYKDLIKYSISPRVVGVFHSHINTDEKFSKKDIKNSEELMLPFWVYSIKTKKHNVYIPENLTNKKNVKNFCEKINTSRCKL
jgi:proteasome lid subunit RPN8/RPN11|tara:strand:- start:1342 stop:1725 length:384 start_codon:yes stop_codon:yes gene_type:complete